MEAGVVVIDVKVLPNGEGLPLPARATPGSAGFDLRAAVDLSIPPGEWRVVPTGIALAIPEGWEGQVRPRSGLAAKHGVTVLNAPGTIDADYRGEIQVPLVNHGPTPFVVVRGERIAQILFAAVPPVELTLVEELPVGHRGDRGFGSTGRS
ncbi:MAG: dUTP diphosphatase [Pseudomonadota bacterium]|nr:dUTP diphosphatase [Pseudomonadota bacterium]